MAFFTSVRFDNKKCTSGACLIWNLFSLKVVHQQVGGTVLLFAPEVAQIPLPQHSRGTRVHLPVPGGSQVRRQSTMFITRLNRVWTVFYYPAGLCLNCVYYQAGLCFPVDVKIWNFYSDKGNRAVSHYKLSVRYLQGKCCGSGSAWIRIDLALLYPYPYWNVDPYPGARKLTKINK